MKKQILTSAFLLLAMGATAQVSVVKDAKSAKSDPVKAAQILAPALTNAETAKDPETWKLAGDFQKAIYDAENTKLFLPNGGADTTLFYNSLLKMFDYYQKADETEMAAVQAGTLKKAKLRKALSKTLLTVRPNLINAGSDAYNAGKTADALNFFGKYIDSENMSVFAETPEVKGDTLVPYIANFAAIAAYTLKDEPAQIKYANIGKSHKTDGYRAYLVLAEVYDKGAAKDSVKWLNTVKEGLAAFPGQENLTAMLMDYYIQSGQVENGLKMIEEMLATNRTTNNLRIKGVLLTENKQYEDARKTFQEIIDKNDELAGDANVRLGYTYLMEAQAIREEIAALSVNDPKATAKENEVKDLYKKALPYYEKGRELLPNDTNLWGRNLLNIYYLVEPSKYEALEKELGM